jgi:cell division protein ZapA (FtsZ GTPase activity inhibitor)
MATRAELILALSEIYELSPNLVSNKLASFERDSLNTGCPSIDALLERAAKENLGEEVVGMLVALNVYFTEIKVQQLIQETARSIARKTRMSAEHVEAFLTPGNSQSEEDRRRQARAFVNNLVHAALKRHGDTPRD